jgi:hypothetical protein
MIPSISNACESHKENVEVTSISNLSKSEDKKDCCDSKSNHDSTKECEDNCCGNTCNCASSCYNPVVTFPQDIFQNKLIPTFKTIQYFHQETYISGVFFSIWLPPKIG